jgi:hypothetical protein
VVHQVAYQLIVTHCGAGPVREHPPYEWELRNPRFNGQKRSQKRAIAIDLGFAEIWLGQSLVNGARAADLTPLQRLQHARTTGLQIDKRPWELVFLGVPRFRSSCRRVLQMDRELRKRGTPPVKDFIILTDFSRCQGYVIGRVSRRSKQPHL